MPAPVAPLVVTYAVAADMLLCSQQTVRRLVERGELRAIHLGDTTSLRIPVAEIERLVGAAEVPS